MDDRRQPSAWRSLLQPIRRAALLLGLTVPVALTSCASAPSTPTTSHASPASTLPAVSLVVIGDSIPNNSPDDCPGCNGFVNRYSVALGSATGRRVEVRNLSQHNGLTLPGLLAELKTFKAPLAAADVILVGIAHNSNELNAEQPCGEPNSPSGPTWAKMTPKCAATSAARSRAGYERLYSTIAALRAGKPTILRTIDRYNDWIGNPGALYSATDALKTKPFIDDWNRMLCTAAVKSGFRCADIAAAINGPDGVKPAGDLLALDYTHLSDKGNGVVAGVLVAEGFAPLAD